MFVVTYFALNHVSLRATNNYELWILNEKCEVTPQASLSKNAESQVWLITSNCEISNFAIKVYNRWGSLVLETNKLNDDFTIEWDLKKVTEGTYFYVINYTISTEIEKLSATGSVLIH